MNKPAGTAESLEIAEGSGRSAHLGTPDDLSEELSDDIDDPGDLASGALGHDDSPVADAPLEMRQVAGLTAGPVTVLHRGTFQFHESDNDVGFMVTVIDPDKVLVAPGHAMAHVDEIELTESTPLNDAVLNVGSACFTVRPPRPAPSADGRLAAIDARQHRPGAIVVPVLTPDPDGVTQAHSQRFGALFAAHDDEPDPELDPEWWRFLEEIRDVRSRVAERHRWLHPDPEELRSRLERNDPGLWDRGREHPLFARVSLAYATIPWEPRFDAPERIPPVLHRPIREMSRLPWVPVTANLHHGPLGIAGSRAAVLAATRHVLLSLCSLTAPLDFALSIVTAKGLVGDWSWTSALPNSMFPDGSDDSFLIAVADGMTHFDGAGLSHEAVLRNEMGLVALAETANDLPEYCGTVLLLSDDGRCQVRNHLGEQVAGTPIGVSHSFAAAVAAMITDAVGDQASRAARRPPPPPPQRPSRAEPLAETSEGSGATDEGVDDTNPPSRWTQDTMGG